MQRQPSPRRAGFWTTLFVLGTLLIGGQAVALGQAWPTYGRDPQHTCLANVESQIPQKIRWSTPVDLDPVYSNGLLFIHYGSPVITRVNTVILPVKVGKTDGFRIDARRATDGGLIWSMNTDYTLPPHSWIPICGVTLTLKDKYLVAPAAGGTVLQRTFPDSASGVNTRVAFYGIANYNANPAAFNAAIKISTPIVADKNGNLYFGYLSTGAALPGYPSGIPSGLARISSTGVGSFVSAKVLSGDNAASKVLTNCAPAISADGSTLYVGVNNLTGFGQGYLCAVNAPALTRKNSVFLLDPRSTTGNVLPATLSDDSSATPTIAPDGDVYFGVLENNLGSNMARGWLLRFSEDLNTVKAPSSFGWDDTPSIVPAGAVPSYTGSSTYLLLTKYNFYSRTGGGGLNRLAVVDPNTLVTDSATTGTNIPVMKPVITVLAPTPDADAGLPNAVREWCINSAAVDAVNKCAVVNNEDGRVYRWDFVTNTLSAGLTLAPPTGEAYTPTLVGPDGAVYAINNARLFCCIAN